MSLCVAVWAKFDSSYRMSNMVFARGWILSASMSYDTTPSEK